MTMRGTMKRLKLMKIKKGMKLQKQQKRGESSQGEGEGKIPAALAVAPALHLIVSSEYDGDDDEQRLREFAIRSSRSRDEKRMSHERSKEEDLKDLNDWQEE